MTMMHVILLYDITSDRIRTRVVTACEDYGLDRIQFSAFYGRLSRNQQQELMLKMGDLLGTAPGVIQLVTIDNDDWKKRLEVRNDPASTDAAGTP